MDSTEFKKLRLRIGWTQERLAQELGITARQIINYEGGKTPIKAFIAKQFKALASEILEQDDSLNRQLDSEKIPEYMKSQTMLHIPLLSAKASAGHGIENFEVETIGEFSISPMLFRTHQSPQHLRLIEVVGDSMSPTLKDGDFVLIDTSKTGGAQDGIYVLILGCDLLVKRLQFELNGDIRILSDNPRYAEKLYTQESQIPLRIVGIVIRAIVRF